LSHRTFGLTPPDASGDRVKLSLLPGEIHSSGGERQKNLSVLPKLVLGIGGQRRQACQENTTTTSPTGAVGV
jgi:hypothetical protein